jgi:hypothetical protein
LHQRRITGCQTIHTVTLKILGSLYFSSGVGQPKIFGGISILGWAANADSKSRRHCRTGPLPARRFVACQSNCSLDGRLPENSLTPIRKMGNPQVSNSYRLQAFLCPCSNYLKVKKNFKSRFANIFFR